MNNSNKFYMLRVMICITFFVSVYFGFNSLVNFMFDDYINNRPYNITVINYSDKYTIKWITNNNINCFLVYYQQTDKYIKPSITNYNNNHYHHYSDILPIIKDILYDFYISCINKKETYNSGYYYLNP